MDDTSPKMAQKMFEMIMTKTPFERLKMGFSMCETSRLLIGRYIRQRYPDISPVEFRKKLFLIFYGDDFNALEKEKILNSIGSFVKKES